MMTDATATLDQLFRDTVARRPDALALLDPRNTMAVTGEPPRRLTYRQADQTINAIASQLRQIGLSAGSTVAIQLPNTAESVLTFMAVIRAGMIATPLPLLWRRADCVAALSRVAPKAMVTRGRIGRFDHATLAMEVAAELFSVRHVCGFGAALPDGVTPLDGFASEAATASSPPSQIAGNTTQFAAITFDVTTDGVVPVARTHRELLAGGLAVSLETRCAPDSVILASLPMTSFAGLATTILPWLICGGTLVLHHPFDHDVLTRQIKDEHVQIAVLPQAIVPSLLDSGAFSAMNGLRSVVSVCRNPERRDAVPLVWNDVTFTDVLAFGETALIAARRDPAGTRAPIRFGPVRAPRDDGPSAIQLAEIAPNAAGRLACRGPMVPHHPFPDNVAGPSAAAPNESFIDTGYACRIEVDTGCIAITAPPPGLIGIGGYRFAIRDLQDLVAGVASTATLAALPDAMAGHRLAGHAPDRAIVRHALDALGINPLVAAAFRERRPAGPTH